MFEDYDVPAWYLMPNPVLCLISAGRTTGLVVSSGHEVTSSVPIFEGS